MTSVPVAICRFSYNNFKRLYLKKNGFFSIFYCLLKCAWKLEHSEKKEEYRSVTIPEIIASKKDVYWSV